MTLSFIEEWVNASPERRRLYAQEGLILSVTEEIWTALERRGWQKQDLAKALGCSNAYVTQLLNGSRNMTLKTLSDIAEALNQRITISLEDKSKPKAWQPMEEPVIQPVRPQILGRVCKLTMDPRHSSIRLFRKAASELLCKHALVLPEEIKEVPFSETRTTVGIMVLPYFTLGITVLPYLRTGNT
jgi:transcriptional regulator with XRE-family HTH domain